MGWLFYFLIFFLSYTLTWVLRRYALVARMVDIPNDRSSHVVPTPRGGGLSICFLFFNFSFLFILQSLYKSSACGLLYSVRGFYCPDRFFR